MGRTGGIMFDIDAQAVCNNLIGLINQFEGRGEDNVRKLMVKVYYKMVHIDRNFNHPKRRYYGD